ncbi:MAG: hypothetical protein V4709_14135 [Pseudomonadota bacterium]
MQLARESEQSSGPPVSEAGLQRVLDSLPAGAYTCDAEGLITYYSPLAEAIWGRAPKLQSPEDRYCGSFKLYWSDGTPMRHDECWMARALQDGTKYNRREVLIERPDGTRTLGLAYANPLRDPQDKIIGALNVVFEFGVHQPARADEVKTPVVRPIPDDAALAMVEIVLGISALTARTRSLPN